MKTFRTNVENGFKKGLSPEENPVRNSGLFIDCRNVRAGKVGLEGYLPAINDIMDASRSFKDSATGAAISITRRWPFPQVFLTDVGIFIGAKEGLFLVADPVVKAYPDILLTSYGTTSTTWPWVCIPILGYPAFTSGNRFVYYDAANTTYTVVS